MGQGKKLISSPQGRQLVAQGQIAKDSRDLERIEHSPSGGVTELPNAPVGTRRGEAEAEFIGNPITET